MPTQPHPADVQPTGRRRSRLRVAVLTVVVAFVALTGAGAAQDTIGWRADMTALTATAAGQAPPLADPVASGNALCFDVCRNVTATYRVDQPAEQTMAQVAARLRDADLTGVEVSCDDNAWCSVTGTDGTLAVTASQYRDHGPAAGYDLTERRTLTVSVGEVD